MVLEGQYHPQGFAAWCSPEWTVISGGFGEDLGEVLQTFHAAGSKTLHTARTGAVHARLTLDGQVHVEAFRK